MNHLQLVNGQGRNAAAIADFPRIGDRWHGDISVGLAFVLSSTMQSNAIVWGASMEMTQKKSELRSREAGL